MFTSRAEYRLLLRHDNADRRLTPVGRRVGLVGDDDWQRLEHKEQGIARMTQYLHTHRQGPDTLYQWLRRTEVSWEDVADMHPALREQGWPDDVIEQVMLGAKYEGYIGRQAAAVERFRRLEGRPIPPHFDYAALPQLRAEAREKLSQVRPTSLGQAGRISGIHPADLAVVLVYLDDEPGLAGPSAIADDEEKEAIPPVPGVR
jgi:tRNA uridine 5-carboxymethylaminomethyl modification enzyme